MGINTQELRDRDPERRAAAYAARDFTRTWLGAHAQHLGGGCTAEWPFVVRTFKSDNFARLLARVGCGEGHDLADDLLAAGLAVPFMVGPA